MKNYSHLQSKINTLLKPGGKLFVHLFVHKDTPYDFESGWKTEHFFYWGNDAECGFVVVVLGGVEGGEDVVGWWTTALCTDL